MMPSIAPRGEGTSPALAAPSLSRRRPPAAFEVATRRTSAWLNVVVSGGPTLEQLVSTLHVIGIESESATRPAMLLDLRAVGTVYGPADLVRVGHEIASSFVHLARVALLVAPGRITRLSERAARRSGLDVRVFDSDALALAWLDNLKT